MKPLDDTREVWRPIPSLPDYLASSMGRIMRVPYLAPMPRGSSRTYGGIPWTGSWADEDARFILQYRGKTYRIAPLICEAFNGPKPHENSVCMHLDEDSRNNRPTNLEWGTQKENLNAPGFLEYCRTVGVHRLKQRVAA